jgi:hypothetical protein
MKTIFIMLAMVALVSCGERVETQAPAQSEELIQWGDEMITPKENALRRIGDPWLAAEISKDMAKTCPVALANYERCLRLADEAAADARKHGATEMEIDKARKEWHLLLPED